MRLHVPILCGLTFAIAGQLQAREPRQPGTGRGAAVDAGGEVTVSDDATRDQGSASEDSTQSNDAAPSTAAGTLPRQRATRTEDATQQTRPANEGGQAAAQPDESTVPQTPPPRHETARMRWLDRTYQGVYDAMWHTAMRVDRWFGSNEDEQQYQSLYGSIAPAVLWDQHYHFKTPFRFNVNLPLPRLNERFNAFIGRVDPNEYVTESEQPSGAFRRQYGPITEDQTLFGLAYHEPERQGGYFAAGAGIRVALPGDPYVKGSYVYERGTSERGLVSLKETAFWQHSDGFGVTSRADIERIYNLRWLVRWTGSATFSEKSLGMRGWSAVDAMRGFSSRRAIAAEIEIDGQTNAPVPLHNYGMKLAYRKGILRRWLVMEVRTSVGWPKDQPGQLRRRSLGIGLAFEALFGTNQFLARPVTF